jgi:hypothetical protein
MPSWQDTPDAATATVDNQIYWLSSRRRRKQLEGQWLPLELGLCTLPQRGKPNLLGWLLHQVHAVLNQF